MTEEQKYLQFEKYNQTTHRIGRLACALMTALLLGAPFVIGVYIGALPSLTATARAFLAVGLVWMISGIVEFLIRNHEKGNKNVILSASKIGNLIEHLKELGIYEYFDEILGIDNIYASSKLQVGLDFIKDKDRKDCIMIGDSVHDYEVAKEMGIRCLLITKGHQNKETLLKTGCEVINDISEVEI